MLHVTTLKGPTRVAVLMDTRVMETIAQVNIIKLSFPELTCQQSNVKTAVFY